MKLVAFLCLISFGIFLNSANAQVYCIECFDSNDSLNHNQTNYITNGGFEDLSGFSSFPSGGYFCPNSALFSGNINGWTCTGGGSSTYAAVEGVSLVGFQNYYCYFGNYFCNPCSDSLTANINNNDTTCLPSHYQDSCVIRGRVSDGFPYNTYAGYGGGVGLSLEQNISGLTVGNKYVLEFWAGGEADTFIFPQSGIFALDVGFGRMILTCKPTQYFGAVGKKYMIAFIANATIMKIKFTNYGHICNICTELILDDVRVYPESEAVQTPVPCKVIIPPPPPSPTYIVPFDSSMVIPNAFSPDNDGWNDYFFAIAKKEIANFYMEVFDRWGTKVFASNSIKNYWDGNYMGSKCMQATYVYYIIGNYKDGKKFDLKGNVTLLRK